MERRHIVRKLGVLIHQLEALLHEMSAEVEVLPPGTVRHRKRKSQIYYEWLHDGKRTSLGTSQDEATRIIRRNLMEASKKPLEHALLILNCLIEELNDVKYDKVRQRMQERFREIDLSLALMPPTLADFVRRADHENSLHPEYLRYKSNGGTMVRSKSELIIANLLEQFDIAYKYEMRLEYNGYTLYPDFTIMKRDGTLIIWEHFGLMDNADYHAKAMKKLQLYQEMGYKQHTNLIITTEDDVSSMAVLKSIVLRFLLD